MDSEKAMDDDKRERHLEQCRERLFKSFRRKVNKATHYRVPPRNVSVLTLQAKKGMTENEIIDTVTKFDEFRLRNLATSQTHSEHPQDRLVVEMVPLDAKTVDGFEIERTDYGIRINRKSNITIIAPTSGTECTIGYFAFYVAQFGGFNLISREFVKDVDDPVSYYTISDEDKEFVSSFISDIKTLSITNREKHWNIIMISADNVYDTQIHFIRKLKQGDNNSLTTIDELSFSKLYSDMETVMKAHHQLSCDLDEKYRPVGPKNIAVKTGGGKDNNAFTLRISYSVTTWMDSFTPIALDMAKEIKQHLGLEGSCEFEEMPEWKLSGNGFGINELTNND